MKFSPLCICLPLAFFSLATVHAEKAEASPSIVRISIEWIEMNSSDATAILRAPRTTTNDNDLRDKVDGMIDAEKALMYESKVVTTHFAAPSRVESIREEIYPTEYDPPGLCSVGPPTVEIKTPKPPMTGFIPTAFETRNTGVTFEVDRVYYAESNTFSIQMTADMVNLVGESKFATYADERMKADMTMPVFYTNRIKTTVIVKPGEYLLATTMTPFGEDGQPDRTKRLVVFVRAELLKVGG